MSLLKSIPVLLNLPPRLLKAPRVNLPFKFGDLDCAGEVSRMDRMSRKCFSEPPSL